tara:strand:+ start:597 stop:791 length:195 start_codon:yes stop_codon:yes gene_type:complete
MNPIMDSIKKTKATNSYQSAAILLLLDGLVGMEVIFDMIRNNSNNIKKNPRKINESYLRYEFDI